MQTIKFGSNILSIELQAYYRIDAKHPFYVTNLSLFKVIDRKEVIRRIEFGWKLCVAQVFNQSVSDAHPKQNIFEFLLFSNDLNIFIFQEKEKKNGTQCLRCVSFLVIRFDSSIHTRV